MKLADIKPQAAKFYLKHPVTLEKLKDDNDKEVFWNVVGHDSEQYAQSRRDFLKYLEQRGDDEDLAPEDYRTHAIKQVTTMVLGWDKEFDDFHGGEFTAERVQDLLSSADHGWIMAQLDSFLANRTNFFQN